MKAAFSDNSEVVLSTPLSSVNLFILAGAPSQAVTITFVLDGTYSQGFTSIKAGNFAVNSKIILILVNGFDGQASGGNGGNGSSIEWDSESGSWLNTTPSGDGFFGGTVYNAEGVDTDIYFSGATPSIAYPTADGYMRAPSGGDGGNNSTFSVGNPAVYSAGDGGNAGDGRSVGVGGSAGNVYFNGGLIESGDNGTSGTIDGSTSGWGVAGSNNDATGGGAGKGVVDSGATVVFFGDTPTRYINGTGDHP